MFVSENAKGGVDVCPERDRERDREAERERREERREKAQSTPHKNRWGLRGGSPQNLGGTAALQGASPSFLG